MTIAGSPLSAQTSGGDFGATQVKKSGSDEFWFAANDIAETGASKNRTRILIRSHFELRVLFARHRGLQLVLLFGLAHRIKPLRKLDNMTQPKQTPLSSTALQQNRPSTSKKIPAQPAGFSSKHESLLPARPKPQQTSQDTGTSSTSMAKFHDIKGTVNFIDDIKLPAQVAGVIRSLNVKEGDTIKAGSEVGLINNELTQTLSDQARVRFDMAQESAKDFTGIRAAEKKYKVASIEANKTRKLGLKGFQVKFRNDDGRIHQGHRIS